MVNSPRKKHSPRSVRKLVSVYKSNSNLPFPGRHLSKKVKFDSPLVRYYKFSSYRRSDSPQRGRSRTRSPYRRRGRSISPSRRIYKHTSELPRPGVKSNLSRKKVTFNLYGFSRPTLVRNTDLPRPILNRSHRSKRKKVTFFKEDSPPKKHSPNHSPQSPRKKKIQVRYVTGGTRLFE